MNITITEHLIPPVTIFHLEGRIHLGTAAQLREKAQEEYDRGARNLILDLSEVQSMTSEGLRSINMIYNLFKGESAERREAMVKSAHVKLLNPSADIRRILNVSGFDLFLEIYDQSRDALASF
jgi:anti-anti-sigma factor